MSKPEAPTRDQFTSDAAYYKAHDKWSESYATPIPASELGKTKKVTLAPARKVATPGADLKQPPRFVVAADLVEGMRILEGPYTGRVSTVARNGMGNVVLLIKGKVHSVPPATRILVPAEQGRPATVGGRKVTVYLDEETLRGASELGASASEGIRNAIMVARAMKAYSEPVQSPKAELSADQTLRQVAAMLNVKQEKRLAGVPLAVRALQVALADAGKPDAVLIGLLKDVSDTLGKWVVRLPPNQELADIVANVKTCTKRLNRVT